MSDYAEKLAQMNDAQFRSELSKYFHGTREPVLNRRETSCIYLATQGKKYCTVTTRTNCEFCTMYKKGGGSNAQQIRLFSSKYL